MSRLVIFFVLGSCAMLRAADTSAELARERQARAEARKLSAAAHKALDSRDYEAAVAQHKRAVVLVQEADAIVDRVVKEAVADLNADDFEQREAATRRLMKLSPGSIPRLEELSRTTAPEVSLRLLQAVAHLQQLDEDSDGRLRQWAIDATASSEYQADQWSAKQATGKPNTPNAGDAPTAWASMNADGGEE
ncbi:MAG TPA: hypothetical protein VEJ63_15850, partial [Planctomycetota bacterium]|nr:hypothetical protein [Planctomycetota bacterium]